jgi:hypothetical protein
MATKTKPKGPAFKELRDRLPPELRAQLSKERRIAKEAATEFVRLCEANELRLLYEYAKRLDECTDAWRLALARVAKLGRVSREIQDAFVSIWIERKMLPLTVADRRIVSDALRILMPRSYSGPCLTVFRGAGAHERRRRIYGFSWSTDSAVARKFAENWAQLPPGGVVLKTSAPPEAIFLIRERDGDDYDESEVVLDPFSLAAVEVFERLLPPSS